MPFGDKVRILPTLATETAGISGLLGCIYGETRPSVTEVSVIGELSDDYAVNVFVEKLNKDFWLDPSLVEFVELGAGEISINGSDEKFVRQSDGSWIKAASTPKA